MTHKTARFLFSFFWDGEGKCTSKDSVLTPYFRSVVGFVFFPPMTSKGNDERRGRKDRVANRGGKRKGK